MFATPNNTCLQHRDSASATSKINDCNIEKFRPNFETFVWNARNMSRTQMQHVCNDLQTKTRNDYILKTNDCNTSRTLLQHYYTTIATLKKSQNMRWELSTRAACPRRQEIPSRPRRWRPRLSSVARARGGGRSVPAPAPPDGGGKGRPPLCATPRARACDGGNSQGRLLVGRGRDGPPLLVDG
jgi:hypothetical protein